ncbi:MAG: family 1 glycosylhydrolase, partial [Acidobacteriota bacterium]
RGRIQRGERSGDAAGWWDGAAEEDLRRAAELGHSAHRLSIEWSRLEPEPGRFDDRAFERYREILGAARDLGLATNVSLYHFTLPRWAAEGGSWLNRDLPKRFARLSHEAAKRLGDLVDLWATINEPNVLAYMAYGEGRWPPGRQSALASFRALRTLLRGHVAARRAVRRIRPDAPVGLVLNMPLFEPAHVGRPLDRSAAAFQDWGFTGSILAGLEDGRLRVPLTLFPRQEPGLAGSFDWLGVNYYGRFAVLFDPVAERPMGRHVQEPTTRTEWVDWGQPCPRGLTAQLMRAGGLGKPVYVTENGLYDNDDRARPRFIIDHVDAVASAIQRGVDVRGYFHWSLVDNFEWTEGWTTHFGLLALDRETGDRTPRRSAEIYARICRSGGVEAKLRREVGEG